MPPKVLYGKKRPVAKSQTSFTKFLSPDKREVRSISAYETAEEPDDRPQQLSRAARSPRNIGEEDAEDVIIAEPYPGRIKDQKDDFMPLQQPAKNGKRAGRRQKKDSTKQVVSEMTTLQVEDDLALGLQALSMRDNFQKEIAGGKKEKKARGALEDRDGNATKSAVAQDVNFQKDKDNSHASGRTVVEVRIPVRNKKTPGGSKSNSTSPRQLLEHKSEVIPRSQDIFSEYVSTLLALSDHKPVLSFKDWLAEMEPHFRISKIAEASFSEVYRLTALAPKDGQKQESVLKVVALKTPPAVPLPSQQQKRTVRDRDAQIEEEMAEREEKDQFKSHVADVLSEVKLLQNLNHIPGFTVFRDLTIVQGRPSAALNNAWKAWNKSRPRGKKSYFPDPSKKASYDETQLWAVVEMQDAGTDCEKMMELGGLTSIWEVWDVFWGVCLSIAKAEEASKFEHRDLHLGNICVRSSTLDDNVLHAAVRDPIKRKLRFTGLETTVIDYTLSRADMVVSTSRRLSSVSCISNSTSRSDSLLEETDIAYLDLNKDPALFEGDASEEYQYEIYRYMRGVAQFKNPLQSAPSPPAESSAPVTPRRSPRKNTHIRFDSGDNKEQDEATPTIRTSQAQDQDLWKSFHPKTNLVWAHFLLHKMLAHMHYHGTTPDKLSAADIMRTIVEPDADPAKVKKKAGKLFKVLNKVTELLCPVALGRQDGLGSMKELVVLALEERWLRCGDVEG